MYIKYGRTSMKRWNYMESTSWEIMKTGNIIISYCVVQFDLVRLDLVW